MGGAALGLVPILIVVGIAVFLLFGVIAFANSGRMFRRPEQERPDADHELRYMVPEGQDPVTVLMALKHHGYDAWVNEPEGRRIVEVICPHDKEQDRADIREAIASADTALEHGGRLGRPVRFLDEPAA